MHLCSNTTKSQEQRTNSVQGAQPVAGRVAGKSCDPPEKSAELDYVIQVRQKASFQRCGKLLTKISAHM